MNDPLLFKGLVVVDGGRAPLPGAEVALSGLD
jgi:hypothetical protein